MAYKYKFTVFTPVYNRAHTIHRVYESLKAQTYNDFEWLVIDDGSTDNIKEIIDGYISEADFPIRYYYKENGGKHTAHNFGVTKAEGELYLTLDSDDRCASEALQVLYDVWESIENKESFSAVTALVEDEFGNIVGDKYPSDIFDSNSTESYYRYNITGEKWGFQRTDVLKEFPFPVIEGTSYISLNTVWHQIAKKYKTRYINKVLRTYYLPENNKGNNLTDINMNPKSITGKLISYVIAINDDVDYFKVNPYKYLKNVVNCARFNFKLKKKEKVIQKINNRFIRVLYVLFLPVAYLLHLKDMHRLKG